MESLDEMVAALSEQHAEDQETLADQLALLMYSAWGLVDFNHLDSSTISWSRVVMPAVKTAYLQSQRLAGVYASNVRFASLPEDEPLPFIVPDVERPQHVSDARFNLPVSEPTTLEPVTLDPFDDDDALTSLLVEANYNVKAAMPGDETEVMHNALVNSTGAATRHAIRGARNATNNVTRIDGKLLGYARYTDTNPCFFCALLAARGAVYKAASFKGGRNSQRRQGITFGDQDFVAPSNAPDVPPEYLNVAKVHNHCRCTLRPVYSKSQQFDSDATFYKEQWKNSSGIDDFRQNFVPYQRRGADVISISEQLQDRETALLNAGFSPASPQVQWATTASALLA